MKYIFSPSNPENHPHALVNYCKQCGYETQNKHFCQKECLFNYLYDQTTKH